MSELAIAGSALAALTIYGFQPRSGPQPALPDPLPNNQDQTVDLEASGGPTRYRHQHILGCSRLVVLVPGISYPMEVYEPLFDTLKAAGRSVLMYDVTGRGYSWSSGKPMTADLLVDQLTQLLDKLGFKDNSLDLVGWSMGTIAVTQFATRYPARVNKLVLLAPVGAVPSKKPATAALLHVPFGIGNMLAALVMQSTLKKLYKEELGAHPIVEFLCDHVARNKAIVRTITSTLRHLKEINDNREVLEAVGKGPHSSKVFVLWGTRDGTILREGIDQTMQLLGTKAKLEVMEGEKHACFLAKPKAANAKILAFLQED